MLFNIKLSWSIYYAKKEILLFAENTQRFKIEQKIISCIFLNFESYSLFSPGILERGHLMLCNNKDSVDIWYSQIFMNPISEIIYKTPPPLSVLV